jgi:hypothetical protein
MCSKSEPLDFYSCGSEGKILYDCDDLINLINYIEVAAADIRNLPGQLITVSGSIQHCCEACVQGGRTLQTPVGKYTQYFDKSAPHD